MFIKSRLVSSHLAMKCRVIIAKKRRINNKKEKKNNNNKVILHYGNNLYEQNKLPVNAGVRCAFAVYLPSHNECNRASFAKQHNNLLLLLLLLVVILSLLATHLKVIDNTHSSNNTQLSSSSSSNVCPLIRWQLCTELQSVEEQNGMGQRDLLCLSISLCVAALWQL